MCGQMTEAQLDAMHAREQRLARIATPAGVAVQAETPRLCYCDPLAVKAKGATGRSVQTAVGEMTLYDMPAQAVRRSVVAAQTPARPRIRFSVPRIPVHA